MSHKDDRQLRCRGRDIHLVPIQFLWHEAEMLRKYGGRVLLFNMRNEGTRKALRTACETNNGYILVSENIHLNRLEAVYDLDRDDWAFPYVPETDHRFCAEQGIDDASHFLHYYAKVEHFKKCLFDDLPHGLRTLIMELGDKFARFLRYPGGRIPADATADTPAQAERSSSVRDESIRTVVTEVFEKAIATKQRIEAKAMPKDAPVPPQPEAEKKPVKGPPQSVVEQRAKKAKPPPKHLVKQLQQRPSADNPAKAKGTDTTVKLEPKEPLNPPPPKREADTTEDSASASTKKIKQEIPPAPPALRGPSQNKMPTPPSTPPPVPTLPKTTSRSIPDPPTRPAPSAPSRAGPIPPPAPPRPVAPQHARPRTPAPPQHHPKHSQQHSRFNFPAPPAPPRRSRDAGSDTTDRRPPLPRTRPTPTYDEEEVYRPDFQFQFNENADLDSYIEVRTPISQTVPDPIEERNRRRRIWDRLLELVGRGVSTGSRALDRMISFGVESVDLSENTYDFDYVPSAEEHFLRQDPGEQGKIYRPRLMISMADDEFSIRVLEQLRDLGRNALAGRAVCSDHPLNNSLSCRHNIYIILQLLF